jgi:hypothetical protein
MRRTLTMLGAQHAALKAALFPSSGDEAAALVELGRALAKDPWTGEVEERFLVRRVLPILAQDVLRASPTSITYSTTPILRLAKQIGQSASLGVVHSHRGELARFSEGSAKMTTSLMWTRFPSCSTEMAGRARTSPSSCSPQGGYSGALTTKI